MKQLRSLTVFTGLSLVPVLCQKVISGASLCLCLKSLVLIHILQATGLQMSVILKIKKSPVSVLHYSQSSTVLALKISLYNCHGIFVTISVLKMAFLISVRFLNSQIMDI